MARHGRDRISAPIAVPGVIALSLLSLPLLAVALRAPWRSLRALLNQEVIRQTMALSVVTSLASAMLCLALGMPLAALLAHGTGRWVPIVRTVATMPIVLPPVVAGVALLLAFGRNGLVGQWLWQWFGVQIPFSTAAVVMAQTFVAMPFLILTLEGALRHADADLADAAATAGATRMQTLWFVTLPAIGPSVFAALMLAWARAFGEFGATITFAGNFPGRTQTLPLSVYLALQTDPDVAIALSLVMIVVSLAVLAGLRERWISAR